MRNAMELELTDEMEGQGPYVIFQYQGSMETLTYGQFLRARVAAALCRCGACRNCTAMVYHRSSTGR